MGDTWFARPLSDDPLPDDLATAREEDAKRIAVMKHDIDGNAR